MRRGLALLSGLVVSFAVATSPAVAARPATAAEGAAIKRVTVSKCGVPGGCRWNGARVSTANPRYAWANVFGEGISGMLVRRPSTNGERFRVIATQGGGIGECAEWRTHAPKRVLRDLRIKGLVASGNVVTCG